MVNSWKGANRGRGRGGFRRDNTANLHVFPCRSALSELCRRQGVPQPEYLWDNDAKSLTLCHMDRIVTVTKAGDKNKSGDVAADIMLGGLYGEHELQEQHQKFDDSAEKAMDTPKWEEKLKHYQSEEGKQERIAALDERKGLTEELKAKYIQKIKDEVTNLEPIEYSSLCSS